jgi:hypothetical protein
MLKKIYIVAVFGLFLTHPAYALSPTPPPIPLEQQPVVAIVEHFAAQYHVSAKKMLNTMQCESSLNVSAVGDEGHSFGLAQIYLPAHKTITQAQAQNAVFASEFMAQEFSEGHQNEWTCYRQIYTD